MISSSSATKSAATIKSIGDLSRSLAEETAEIESLLEVLRDEQRALQARDMECVHSFAITKSEHLARLGAFGALRSRFLQAKGLPQDSDGMQRYLEHTAGTFPAAGDNWRRLLANAAQARRINAVNGRLIAAELRFVSGALVALRQGSSRLVCYGADGQARAAATSRSLASA